MSWTKGQIVEQMLAEIGLSDYVFNVVPEERQSALRRLDAMLATWDGKGIRLGYPLPSTADGSNLDDDSGLPDVAIEAVIANGAMRIAPSYGKTVSAQTMTAAKEGYNTLLARATFPPQQQFPNTLPRGAGNKYWRGGFPRPFMPTPADPIVASQGGDQITLD